MNGDTRDAQVWRLATFKLSGVLVVCAVGCLGLALSSRHHVILIVACWLLLVSIAFIERLFWSSANERDTPCSHRDEFNPPNWFSSAIALWLLLTAAIGIGYESPSSAPRIEQSVIAACGLGALILALLVLSHYCKRTTDRNRFGASQLTTWCRASLAVVLFAFVSVSYIGFTDFAAQHLMIQPFMLLCLAPGVEWLVRSLASEHNHVSLTRDIKTLNHVFGLWKPANRIPKRSECMSNAEVGRFRGLAALRKTCFPILALLALSAWTSTSVVTVGIAEAGIHERFGATLNRSPLGPGIHLKAPWPIDRIQLIDVGTVRNLPLGFVGPRAGSSLLWTKQHASQEHQLLLGDGRDLVTINATLQYTVRDPFVWHLKAQNPERALRFAAEQALLKNTAGRSLDEVLSENTAQLAREIETEIRRNVVTYKIGAEIVGLTLQGLHPPISVAEDYQAVVSAQHQREILVLESRQYELSVISAAKAAAIHNILKAQSSAAHRVANSKGEAGAFNALETVHSKAPASTRLGLRLQAIEAVVRGRPSLIIDDRIEDDGGTLWFED